MGCGASANVVNVDHAASDSDIQSTPSELPAGGPAGPAVPGEPAISPKKVPNELPWRGNPGTYLGGFAADGGVKHGSFEAAMSSCLGDPTAGGVTQEGDGVYTVRSSGDLAESPSGGTSWLKADLLGIKAAHEGKYLGGYAGDGGKRHATFADARAACMADAGAGGITREGDNMYTVRSGTDLSDSPSGELSWLKSELDGTSRAPPRFALPDGGPPLLVTVDGDLSAIAETLVGESAIRDPPGACVAILKSPQLPAKEFTLQIAAAGERQRGSGNRVQPGDVWHMGSCSKAMTATLAAMLIESGDFPGYDFTVAQTKDAGKGWYSAGFDFDGSFDDVTLEQFLCHTAGVPPAGDAWSMAWEMNETDDWGNITPMMEQRAKYLQAVFAQGCSGTGIYSYSNEGYTMAAHMLEIFCGQTPYETLIKERLFAPLGMSTAGFGAAGANGDGWDDRCKYPWGHGPSTDPREHWNPKDPRDSNADNPMAITPAGRVHCTMEDWAKFITVHIDREAASSLLGLSSETFDAMHKTHQPSTGTYCRGGFIPAFQPWQCGDANLCLNHMGSNCKNMCNVWLTEGKAAMVCTNHGGAEDAISNAMSSLFGLFF